MNAGDGVLLKSLITQSFGNHRDFEVFPHARKPINHSPIFDTVELS